MNSFPSRGQKFNGGPPDSNFRNRNEETGLVGNGDYKYLETLLKNDDIGTLANDSNHSPRVRVNSRRKGDLTTYNEYCKQQELERAAKQAKLEELQCEAQQEKISRLQPAGQTTLVEKPKFEDLLGREWV